MLKPYKRIERALHYHEAWAHGSKITEHWGKVGERGETAEHKRNKKLRVKKDIEQILAKSISDGYEPIDDDSLAVVLIEFAINGMGTTEDLDKRHALQERMDETLGWTGVGNCDGGSTGSGTMEVCCFVVDSEIAKRVIEDDLKGTVFEDYSRIFVEDIDDTGDAPIRAEEPAATGPSSPRMMVPPWMMCQGIDRADPEWQNGQAGGVPC